jgi:hypothetical protein
VFRSILPYTFPRLGRRLWVIEEKVLRWRCVKIALVFDIEHMTILSQNILATVEKVSTERMLIGGSYKDMDFTIVLETLKGWKELTMSLKKQARTHALSPYRSKRTILFRQVGMRHHIFLPCLYLFEIRAQVCQYESPILSPAYRVMTS